jgi:hypothetical protein
MPFTFSHPAIILPLLEHRKISATALVVGSMSPDFEYFFRMKMQSEISHSFLGILLIDFPLGFLVMCVFHGIIKNSLIDHLPSFFKARLQLLKNNNWFTYLKNNVLVVCISFIIGALSHLFWDSMTHWDGYIVQRVAFLNAPILNISIYKLMQHLSSIVGLAIILHFIYKLPVLPTTPTVNPIKYWMAVTLITSVILTLRFSFGLQLQEVGSLIVSILFSGMIALTVVGLFYKRKTAN